MLDARIVARRDLGASLALVRIAREDGALHVFTPGQHITVALPSGNKLPYSIVSAPGLAYLELFVSLSEAWPKVGERVGLGAPGGVLTLDGVPDDARLIFVATGTGVSPFVSMLRTYAYRRAHSTLIQGARNEEELPFRDELAAMPGLVYRPTLSQPGEAWMGLRGRVQTWLEQEPIGDAHVFLCGHAPMIEDARAALRARGLAADRIHAEAY
jgi:ferredoxin-NADP reductase